WLRLDAGAGGEARDPLGRCPPGCDAVRRHAPLLRQPRTRVRHRPLASRQGRAHRVPENTLTMDNVNGVRFFAWLGAIALFLAGVFAAPAIVAIVAGIALLILCWFLPQRHPITTNAAGGAGGGMLFACCYVLFNRGTLTLAVTFVAMAIVV